MFWVFEVWRRRVQVAPIALIIALFNFLVLMINGLGIGLNEQAGSALRNFDADAIAYSDAAGLSVIRSELSQEQVDRIAADSGAEAATPLGYVAANYRTSDGLVRSAAFLGFDVGSFAEPDVVRGRMLTAADNDGLLADRGLLRRAGLEVGDTVTITLRLTAREFQIIGETNEGAFFFQPSVYVLRSTWQELKYGERNDGGPVASIVLLQGDDLAGKSGEGWEAVSKSVAFANIEGVSGQQSTIQALRAFGYIIGGLVIGVFFYVLTLQKIGQIGVLKAVGASSFFLFRQVVVQVMVIAIAGVAIAVPLAWFTNELIKQSTSPVPISFTNGTFITTSVLLVVMALVGAMFSGRQVARVDPIIALGQQQ